MGRKRADLAVAARPIEAGRHPAQMRTEPETPNARCPARKEGDPSIQCGIASIHAASFCVPASSTWWLTSGGIW
jgi:hypothetical protein